jgi:diaminopimelate decarboxylase
MSFHRVDGHLWCDDVSLADVARAVATPAYVYSATMLRSQLHALQAGFASRPTVVCYSVKANSTLALLGLFAQGGAGFDIVSGGELHRVLQAQASPQRIVFSGVGKTAAELAQALAADIWCFNVESRAELHQLANVAQTMGRVARFAIRVNPDVDAKTHRYIATGLKTSKFGVPFDEAVALYDESKILSGVNAVGLDCHIGSQLLDLAPLRQAITKVGELFRVLQHRGHSLTHLDVGGGLGVTYTDEKPPSVREYAHAVLEPLKGIETTLVLEPGRWLVANAGVLLTQVLYDKPTADRHFVVVDAGMNDLLRPALYEAHHEIVPVSQSAGASRPVDVVGPVCESSDVLGSQRLLPRLMQGDVLAVKSAGAYGMAMASTYNSRPRPAEVLVDGGSFRVVRQRETFDDLLRGETL